LFDFNGNGGTGFLGRRGTRAPGPVFLLRSWHAVGDDCTASARPSPEAPLRSAPPAGMLAALALATPAGVRKEATLAMIRLLHVEPNTMVRTVLKDLLGREDVDVVASVARLSEIPPERAAELGADLLLIGVSDPENGFDSIRRWRARARGVRVLILTSADDPATVAAAMRAGGDGLLATREGPEALGRAIALVAMGEKAFPEPEGGPAGAAAVPDGPRPPAVPVPGQVPGPALGPMERIVLEHLRAGCSNHRIALLTGQTEADVKVQVHAVLRKLKVRNRTQAALWAARNWHLLDESAPDARIAQRSG
jgi:two-component system nitrate/nitrite response regulator NarL